jgi:hypothetical protein
MRTTCFSLSLLLCGFAPLAAGQQPVPVGELGKTFQLVGTLRLPLGEMVTVEGVVVEGPFKGYEGGPNLRVQRIQGRYTQECIQIPLKPYFGNWGDGELPKLATGKTYQMSGYETGRYVGMPAAINQAIIESGKVPIQTTSHYFQSYFAVSEAEKIEPILYTPMMFEGERALLSGVARTIGGDSAMTGKGWVVIVRRGTAWEAGIEGKQIECDGRYNPEANSKVDPKKCDLLDGTWRLVHLKDQVGQEVSLRGTARSLNGEWWLNYRGTDLHVDGMASLPGWSNDMHYCPVIIEGKLERAKLPRIDQISEKTDRDLAESFVVRQASWKPLPALLFPELPVEKDEP